MVIILFVICIVNLHPRDIESVVELIFKTPDPLRWVRDLFLNKNVASKMT